MRVEESMNMVQPNSVASLLAEEWTIRPSSIMPSFAEMMMIHQASQSSHEALGSAINIALRWLNSSNDSPLSATTATLVNMVSAIRRRLRLLATNHRDEIHPLVLYLLERSSLQSSASATVSEALYGTKRSKLVSFADHNAGTSAHGRRIVDLSGNDQTRLALLSALAPYVKHKCYQLHRKYRVPSLDGNGSVNRRNRILGACYLSTAVVLASMKVLCQWRFLAKQSLFFSPSSLLLNQIVRRVTQSDATKGMASQPVSTNAKQSGDCLTYLLTVTVAVSWIAQMRVAWANRRREQRQHLAIRDHSAAGSDTPPPSPPCTIPTSFGKHATKYVDDRCCSLCLGPRTNPTATSSGHVFCELCIRSHVRRFQRCPATGVACKESMLIRLFEPSNTGRY
ncbi:hypothetical protein MPSEU_000469200 [Mayamaea pseudoterrestris]|nr:hypothetical protein MPSEU_000469200 [Mayamaea pseudoterrestris]